MEKKIKKLTPQQIRVGVEKQLAKNSKIEDLLIDSETIKQQIDERRDELNKFASVTNKTIKNLEVKQHRAKRLIRYKREQIVSKKK